MVAKELRDHIFALSRSGPRWTELAEPHLSSLAML